jgi:hypothetical protein
LITESASLLADEEELSSISILGSDDNSSIRHNSVPDHVSTPTESGIESISISEVGINQDGIIKTTDSSSTEKSSSSIHVTQNGASEIDLMQTTPVQIDRLPISFPNNRSLQSSFYQNSTSQVSTSQVSTSQVGVSQTSPTQVNIPQTNSFEVNGIFGETTFGLEQLNSSKISFPVTITNDQFFRGDFPNHNSTSEIINVLNNSPTDIDSFDEQNIEPEAIYGIKSTNIPLTNIPDSHWVSSLNLTYAIGDRTDIGSFGGQNIEPEAIYGIKSTNISLINIPDSLRVSSLNSTYAIGYPVLCWLLQMKSCTHIIPPRPFPHWGPLTTVPSGIVVFKIKL